MTLLPHPVRPPALLRALQRRALCTLALLLCACAAVPPAPRWLRLPTEAPTGAQGAERVPASAADGGWALLPWGALPDWMDRQDVLVADGAAGLRALQGVRWAEPLRDALPRLLALDLAALRAPQVLWTGSVPPGAQVARQLRVQVLALDNLPKAGQVRLLARWSLADPAGRLPALLVDERITQPWDGSADGLAMAQRAVLWTLARHIVQGGPLPADGPAPGPR